MPQNGSTVTDMANRNGISVKAHRNGRGSTQIGLNLLVASDRLIFLDAGTLDTLFRYTGQVLLGMPSAGMALGAVTIQYGKHDTLGVSSQGMRHGNIVLVFLPHIIGVVSSLGPVRVLFVAGTGKLRKGTLSGGWDAIMIRRVFLSSYLYLNWKLLSPHGDALGRFGTLRRSSDNFSRC
eukprot:scaffold6562_cov163-Amphora_coffeaeformis.AAC.18